MNPPRAAKWRRRAAAAAVVAVAGAFAAAALWRAFASDSAGGPDNSGKADREHPIVTAARIVEKDGHRLIHLDAEAMRRAGIRSEPLRAGGQPETIEAFASVLDLQGLSQRAAALAAANAQSQAVRARLAASKAEAGRLQRLYEQDQTASASQAQAAQAAFLADQAALAGAQAQAEGERSALRLEWGEPLAAALEDPARPLHALLDELLSRRRVLVQVVVESPGPVELSSGRVPLNGRVVLDDGGSIALQFVAPSPRPDPRLAGRAFLYSAPAQAALAPGATLRASLPSGRTSTAQSAPPSAVVWWQGRAWIYLRRGESDFERWEAGIELAGERPAAVAGLEAGTPIVVQGAQVLLSEELRAENFSTDVGGR